MICFPITAFQDFFSYFFYYFWETSTRSKGHLRIDREAESEVSHDGNVVNMLERNG